MAMARLLSLLSAPCGAASGGEDSFRVFDEHVVDLALGDTCVEELGNDLGENVRVAFAAVGDQVRFFDTDPGRA